MSSPLTIKIPLLNPNETEAKLVAMHVSDGQHVTKGEPICTLETTKSTTVIDAEASGYIVGLRFREGQMLNAGDHLCYLADSPDWTPPNADIPLEETETTMWLPEGLRITQPALNLANRHNLDLGGLHIGPLITKKDIQSLIEESTDLRFPPPENDFDSSKIIVYGGGGHGKSLVDMLRALDTFHIIGVVDDGIDTEEEILGLPILGGSEVLPDLHQQGVRLAVNAVGGIGNLKIRMKVFNTLAKAGFICPAVVHPTAFIEQSAILSPGVQVFPHAYVGSEARLGFGTIVNTGAIVSHDCVLGDYVNISPGAMVAGMVHIGSASLIGMGVTVNLEVNIQSGSRIGNGATVKSDVPKNSILRAGTIWPD